MDIAEVTTEERLARIEARLETLTAKVDAIGTIVSRFVTRIEPFLKHGILGGLMARNGKSS